MLIYKAYKFRVYPNKEQKELIDKTLGCNRFIYNYFLNRRIKEYKDKTYENIKLDLENKLLTISKIKNLKIRGYRKLNNINSRIINVTISREKNSKYYVSILVEDDIFVPKFMPTKIVGIDLGIKDLVITSNFEKYKNEKAIKKNEKRIKSLQKNLSRKVYKSKNYFKTKKLLAKVYSKLANVRKYTVHSTS